MQNILISVIMPVYNSGQYLDDAVKSVLSQDFESFELILVDDGSSDGSEFKCDSYAEGDARVVVIHQKNAGICNARNNAIKVAKGDFIAFADHDDLYHPGLLTTVYNCVKANDVDFVKFSKIYKILNANKLIRSYEDVISPRVIHRQDYSLKVASLITEWALDCVWDGLYKRSVIIENNLKFDESFKKGGEDIAFNIKYLNCSKKMQTLSESYYTHFVRMGFSTSSKFNPRGIEDQKRLTSLVFDGLNNLQFDFDSNKRWYAYYLMRNYFCIIAGTLASQKNTMTIKEKQKIIIEALNEKFVPNWFLTINAILLLKYSFKLSFAFFFLKYNLLSLLFSMFSIRKFIPFINIK